METTSILQLSLPVTDPEQKLGIASVNLVLYD